MTSLHHRANALRTTAPLATTATVLGRGCVYGR